MKTFSDSFRKNAFACIFGPLAVIPATIVYALAFKIIAPQANSSNFELVPFVAFIALAVAYPATLFLGLPISLILQKMGKFNLVNLLIVSTISISTYGVISGAHLTEFVLAIYFSIFVVTGCWYLHRAG